MRIQFSTSSLQDLVVLGISVSASVPVAVFCSKHHPQGPWPKDVNQLWPYLGFGALASLAVPCRIPLLMIISERGTLGEFNLGQALVCRTMRPVLEALGIESHTVTRLDELEFVADRSIEEARDR